MKAERIMNKDAAIIITLIQMEYKTLESKHSESESHEKFFYSMDAGLSLNNGKQWCVTVIRTVEALYQATLIYNVRILWRGKKTHQDDDYKSPLNYALDMIADRASYVLSTLTNDSFMTPLITPPFFDNESYE